MSVLGFDVGTRYRYSVLGFEQSIRGFRYNNGTCRYFQVDKKILHFPVLAGTGTFNFNVVKIRVLQLTFMPVRNNSKFYTSTKVQDVLQEHNL